MGAYSLSKFPPVKACSACQKKTERQLTSKNLKKKILKTANLNT